MYNTLDIIFLQAIYHNLKHTILQQQLQHSNLSQDKIEVFVNTWAVAGPEIVEKFRQRILSPHKVIMIEICAIH